MRKQRFLAGLYISNRSVCVCVCKEVYSDNCEHAKTQKVTMVRSRQQRFD